MSPKGTVFQPWNGEIYKVEGDMITSQSLTMPIPEGLVAGEVGIKVYPWKFGSQGR